MSRLKDEVSSILGHKAGEAFANTIGAIGERDFKARFSYKDIMKVRELVNSSQYSMLVEDYEVGKLKSSIDFLQSFKKIVNESILELNEGIAFLEERMGEDLSAAVVGPSDKVFDHKRKQFLKETVRQIQEDQRLGIIFKVEILENKSADSYNKEELVSKISYLSKQGVGNSIKRLFLKRRDDAFKDFEIIFSRDIEQFSSAVLADIQENGFFE